ncbi:MAG: hypothetical protein WCJ19_02710 [bacterium]
MTIAEYTRLKSEKRLELDDSKFSEHLVDNNALNEALLSFILGALREDLLNKQGRRGKK